MSNAELRQHLSNMENEFNARKNKVQKLFEEMSLLENEYLKIEREIKLRKTIEL